MKPKIHLCGWIAKVRCSLLIRPALPGASTPSAAAPFDYGQTFLLHSNPGATRSLYLDFNGHTVSGTAWNASYTPGAAFTANAYDSDGSPGSFSSAEMDEIQAVWQYVSEDFAPFDIDVTTQDPGNAGINRSANTDNTFGTRVVITATSTIRSSCGCGGIAYVGSINNLAAMHDYYQPAFVFTGGVGNGAKNISEAASHEAGHNLGLSHDGTASVGYYSGHGVWAPIMGVGYSKPVSQWSSGEYSGANNHEDDFAIAVAHEIPLRADDFGSLTAPSELSASPVSVSGVITTAADQDVFQINAEAGSVSFTATAAPFADLDIELRLVNAAGSVVASDNPAVAGISSSAASGLSASITATVTVGTYRIVVDGIGSGSASTGYTDYGSRGRFALTGTYIVASGPTTTTTLPPITGKAIRVQSVATTVIPLRVGSYAQTIIVVTDGNGVALSGVRIKGTLTGPAGTRKVTGTTSKGQLKIKSPTTKLTTGTFTFTATTVTKTKYQYDAANSVSLTSTASF